MFERSRSANLGFGHKRLGNLRFQADALSASQTYQPGGKGMAEILSAVQTSHDRGDRDSYLPDRAWDREAGSVSRTCGSNLPNLAIRVVGLDRAWGEVRLRPSESAVRPTEVARHTY